MATYGILVYGPLNYTWYVKLLPKLVPTVGAITTK